MDRVWGQAKTELERLVGANNYANWIQPLRLASLRDGTADLVGPTKFLSDWVARHYAEPILNVLVRHGCEVERLTFRVDPAVARGSTAPLASPGSTDASPASAAMPQVQAPSAKPVGRPEEELTSTLDARFTFDNFVVGKPNELAHAAARRVAEGGPVSFNPLFLYGGVGLGKTHLTHAIARERQARDPQARILYLSAEQFMYRFVQALRERTVMDFKELFRTVDLLMVDDVQFIAGKDSTQEEFFHTFNALVDQGKQIVISADRAPGEIKDMEERIKSRLSCGLIVDLHPTDYELRLSILQSKTEQFRQTYPGLRLGQGVLEFLAHRITSNVRVLEGALQRLFAFASLMGREIDLDMTQECLTDILRASDRKVTVEEIQRKVAEHYNIRLSAPAGPKRVRPLARPRQIAMYLAKQMTSRSLPEIGRRFGGRDHTTIMHGIRKIEELRTEDRSLAEDIDLLRRSLEA